MSALDLQALRLADELKALVSELGQWVSRLESRAAADARPVAGAENHRPHVGLTGRRSYHQGVKS